MTDEVVPEWMPGMNDVEKTEALTTNSELSSSLAPGEISRKETEAHPDHTSLQNPQTSRSRSSSENFGAELDGLEVAELDGDQCGSAVTRVGERPPEFMTPDEFFAFFEMTHLGVAAVTSLKSVAISPQERPVARQASDGIYYLAQQHPAFHWIIKPGARWMQAVAGIGLYAARKAPIVLAEVRERNKAAAASRRSADEARPAEPEITGTLPPEPEVRNAA